MCRKHAHHISARQVHVRPKAQPMSLVLEVHRAVRVLDLLELFRTPPAAGSTRPSCESASTPAPACRPSPYARECAGSAGTPEPGARQTRSARRRPAGVTAAHDCRRGRACAWPPNRSRAARRPRQRARRSSSQIGSLQVFALRLSGFGHGRLPQAAAAVAHRLFSRFYRRPALRMAAAGSSIAQIQTDITNALIVPSVRAAHAFLWRKYVVRSAFTACSRRHVTALATSRDVCLPLGFGNPTPGDIPSVSEDICISVARRRHSRYVAGRSLASTAWQCAHASSGALRAVSKEG